MPKFYDPKKQKPLEKSIEKSLGRYAESKGCLWWKFTSPMNRSVPDRVVVTPNGVVAFLELKRPGKDLTPGQAEKAQNLRDHKALVDWADNVEKGKRIIDEWCAMPGASKLAQKLFVDVVKPKPRAVAGLDEIW